MEELTLEQMKAKVMQRFPEAFCEQIEKGNFINEQGTFAVFKSKDMWRERLSLSPFQGHSTAKNEIQAWREAYAKVSHMNSQTELF